MKKSPIIILHGWGLSAKKFEPLADVLKIAGFRVYTPDFPGFGLAKEPDRPYKLQDYAFFLHEYIQKHTINHPILIGHSFGGRVALKYNYLYPNSVRALILSGTPGFTPVSRQKLILFITLAKIGKYIMSIWPLTVAQSAIRKWYYYVVGAREYYRATEVMRETFKHIVEEKLEIPMKANTAPTLLLWGEQDYITPTRIPRQMHAVMPHAQLRIVRDADHGFPYKQSGIFCSYVQAFIQSL